MASETNFQRARRPEQIAERRAKILEQARDLLTEERLLNISLRELSARVGLSKSNVLRYFESREAIFLEILDAEWRDWLDVLEAIPPPVHSPTDPPHARERETAQILTRTLTAAPLLCELFGNLGSVLEHNISIEYARLFKQRSIQNAQRLRRWLMERLPVDDTIAQHLAAAIAIIAGALSTSERPSDNVATVTAEFGGLAAQDFPTKLFAGLNTHLTGATALAAERRAAPTSPQ